MSQEISGTTWPLPASDPKWVEEVYRLCTLNTQMLLILMADIPNHTEAAATVIASLGKSVAAVMGPEERNRVLNAYTAGAYTEIEELLDMGVSLEQAIQVQNKKGKKDA